MPRPLRFLDVDGVLHLWGDEAEPMTYVRLGNHTLRHAAALPELVLRRRVEGLTNGKRQSLQKYLRQEVDRLAPNSQEGERIWN